MAFSTINRGAIIKQDNISFQVAKGAPQVILELVQQPVFKKQVENAADQLANEGHRALGIARRNNDDKWHYLELIALFDPPLEMIRYKPFNQLRIWAWKLKCLLGTMAPLRKKFHIRLAWEKISFLLRNYSVRVIPTISQLERVDGFAEVFP